MQLEPESMSLRFLKDISEEALIELERSYSLNPNIDMVDIVTSFQRLKNYLIKNQLDLKFSKPYPGIKVNNRLIPVDYFNSEEAVPLEQLKSPVQLYEVIESWCKDNNLMFSPMSFSDTEHEIKKYISETLNRRANFENDSSTSVFGVEKQQGAGGASTGLKVTVHNQQQNSEILYSPCIPRQFNKRFGGVLSSPVTSWVGPGEYVFGVKSSNGGAEWDSSTHDIPPNFDIHLLSI